MQEFSRNQLLAALPDDVRSNLLADCMEQELRLGTYIHEQDEPIYEVVFPTSGIVSLVTVMADGMAVEAAMVGREGAAGIPSGPQARAPWRAMVQVEGVGLSIPVERLRRHVDASPELRHLTEGYSAALLAFAAQSAACNRFHELPERLARWLLMTHDRVDSDSFAATHEFLASMLGAHRPSVTLAARHLQEARLISYSRGRIEIRDAPGLREAACECYDRIRRRYETLFAEG